MITEKRLLDIVEKLLVKANADEIHWKHDAFVSDDNGDNSFTVEFKESKFYIQYSSPPTEPDGIEIGIENKQGDPLKRLSIEEDESDPRWSLVFKLYQEAERSVLGTDRVLDEIEEELQKEGAIGLS